MKTLVCVTSILLFASLAACSRPGGVSKKSPEIESILLCDGAKKSILAGESGNEHFGIKLTKVGNKVARAKILDVTYTLEKVDASTPKNKGPIYRQLIVEPERIILRAEITEDKQTYETVIENSGRYKADRMLGWSEGTCKATDKVF